VQYGFSSLRHTSLLPARLPTNRSSTTEIPRTSCISAFSSSISEPSAPASWLPSLPALRSARSRRASTSSAGTARAGPGSIVTPPPGRSGVQARSGSPRRARSGAPWSLLLQLLLLTTFAIKAAVFPLSFWLPDSYPTAPAPVTAVFAGLLTKVGVYAILRTQTLLFPDSPLTGLFLWAALLTMLVGILARSPSRTSNACSRSPWSATSAT
jgi:hypothetical protein